MVDLAKIRKKVKNKLMGGEPAVSSPPESSSVRGEPSSLPVDESSRRRTAGSTSASVAGEDSTRRLDDSSTPVSPPGPAAVSKLDRFKQDAGKRRDAFRLTDAHEVAQNTLELLTFLIAGEQYAVEIDAIVEIVPPRAVTRIPNAHETVVGIMSLRGTIVTIVDVRSRLRHPPGQADHNTRIIVIDFHRETIGFAVDRVLRVVKVPAGEIEPHPVVHATELEDSIRGVFHSTGALTILLDLDKLLDSHAVSLNPWT